jgi:hypothetical protein
VTARVPSMAILCSGRPLRRTEDVILGMERR